MKKTILILFLLFQITAFSQAFDLFNCDGITVFDLTANETQLIGTQNPNDIVISYHESLAEAQNNTNTISTPTSYTAISSTETKYARVENVVTSNVSVESFQIYVIETIVIASSIISNDCIDGANVVIILSGGNPDLPFSYTINSGPNMNIVGNPAEITLTGVNQPNIQIGVFLGTCSKTETIIIPPLIPINTSLSIDQPFCNGDVAAITVTATGGSAPYQYSMDGGASFQTSNVFTSIPPGMYTIFVMDSNGCTDSQSIVIESPLPITANLVASGNTIAVNNVTGGTPPYQYSISSNPTVTSSNNVFTNLSSGNYCVQVFDSYGCFFETCITIEVVLDLQINGAYVDYNNDGFVNIGDIINYDFTVINNETLDATNITLDSFGLSSNGGTITTLNGGASDTSTFLASYVLTQNDINNGSVANNFQVNGTYDGNPTATLVTNTTNLSISDGIKLNAFLDTNGNNIQDNGEQNINIGSFEYQINNGNTVSIVSSTGMHYLYESNPVNTYNLSYVINSANATQYTLSQNNYANVTVVANSGITTYNFPLTIIPYVDLQVYLNQNGALPRPGFPYTNRITYRNLGNQTISGTVTFTNDNVITVTAISEASAVTTANGFTYDFTNLLPNETHYIYVTMQTPTIPTVALGDVLTNAVAITIPSGDVNVNNNEAALSQIIVGSYDPNDKTEVHGGKIVHADFSTDDYLTYTIQFENTGTANAVTVKVDDVLDAMLDASTLKMVDASHNYVLERDGNNLSWKFNGIDLPPSVANTNTGKGYIVFQIKPTAGYAIGDIIPNTANIYFDFNPAIITNTYTTEFIAPLSNQSFEANSFVVYPNPAKEEVFISIRKNTSNIESLSVTDILGKSILDSKVNSTSTRLDVSHFQKGIYFLKIKANGSESIVKIMKQ
ncbi:MULTISPECIES: T9SS type A sorting domain-containing protein [Flavobacterium]|uniref:T9SS type A sorting domain-containing protein n=1 Tax=Flavobacterium jumunjinense TaxID=998845 RepID=A0ABV5GTM0_9FLAO|nr:MULTISPECIES: T9SS type A sorting domain-containing protein [Flavobacterium]